MLNMHKRNTELTRQVIRMIGSNKGQVNLIEEWSESMRLSEKHKETREDSVHAH